MLINKINLVPHMKKTILLWKSSLEKTNNHIFQAKCFCVKSEKKVFSEKSEKLSFMWNIFSPERKKIFSPGEENIYFVCSDRFSHSFVRHKKVMFNNIKYFFFLFRDLFVLSWNGRTKFCLDIYLIWSSSTLFLWCHNWRNGIFGWKHFSRISFHFGELNEMFFFHIEIKRSFSSADNKTSLEK